MDSDINYLYVGGYIIVTAAVWFLALRNGRGTVLGPLSVYCGSYFFTTVIGATIIGIQGPDVLDSPDWGINIADLGNVGTPEYWFLLFAPLIIAPLCSLLFYRLLFARSPSTKSVYGDSSASLSIRKMAIVFMSFAALCFGELYRKGYLNIFDSWSTLAGDYTSLIQLRTEMFSALSFRFFGMVYITIPTLSHCALYQAIHRGTRAWWLMFLGTFVITSVLCLATIQKSILLVYFVSLGVGLLVQDAMGIRFGAAIVVGSMFVLSGMQAVFTGEWNVIGSMHLLIFRLASSYPFYLFLYPSMTPFVGIDLGQSILGIGETPRDNLDVFAYMHPSVTWVEGSATAAAHVRSYAQAGVMYAVVTIVMIGLAVSLIGALRQRLRGPLSYALYVQSLVSLYYVTQTSLTEAVFAGYGIVWSAVGLVPLFILTSITGSSSLSRQFTFRDKRKTSTVTQAICSRRSFD